MLDLVIITFDYQNNKKLKQILHFMQVNTSEKEKAILKLDDQMLKSHPIRVQHKLKERCWSKSNTLMGGMSVSSAGVSVEFNNNQ